MHQCLPVGISDTSDWLAFFGLPVDKLYLSAGFLQDPYWAWTESIHSDHLFSLYAENRTSSLHPSRSLLWPSDAHAGLLKQCHGTERPATSHFKGFELSILVIFLKNHFKVKLLYCLSCVCQSWVFVEVRSRQHHKLLWDLCSEVHSWLPVLL